MKKIAQNIFDYVDARFKLKGLIEFSKHKKVPEHE